MKAQKKLKIHKNWEIYIIILFIIIIVVIFIYPTLNCRLIQYQLNNELNNSNSCDSDDDCEVLESEGAYISLGGYHFVNKEADKKSLYKKLQDYFKKCRKINSACAPIKESKCFSGKCVGKGFFRATCENNDDCKDVDCSFFKDPYCSYTLSCNLVENKCDCEIKCA